MTAALWGAVASAVVLLLNAALAWLQQHQAFNAGTATQALASTSQAAKTATAVAQAVVAAPADRLALVDQLKKGTF